MSCLCILEINPLSIVFFIIIFSHSEICLFTLFIVSFAVQKLLHLIRLHLLIFVFISIILGGGTSPTQRTWVWVNSWSWWWTGKLGVLQSRGLQRVGHDWVTELKWIETHHFWFLCFHLPCCWFSVFYLHFIFKASKVFVVVVIFQCSFLFSNMFPTIFVVSYSWQLTSTSGSIFTLLSSIFW